MTHMYLVKGGLPYTPAFRIDNLNNLNWSVDTPVTPMPLPEDTHEENILVKMEGNTAKMDLSWTLTEAANFGTLSRGSNGVYSFVDAGEQTVYKQINDFKEKFIPISIGDSYKLIITDDSHGELMSDEGTISNMSFSVSGTSPIVWNVSCSFYVGNVVAMLEADIPPAPTSVVCTSPGTAQLKFVVTAYDGYSSEPSGDNAILGVAYKIKRTDKKGTWSEVKFNAQTDATNIQVTETGVDKSNPTSGVPVTYRVKVAQYNANNITSNQYYWKYGHQTVTVNNETVTSTDITIT